MVTRVALHLLKVGSCRHCERITLRGGGVAPVSFPALSALIVHPLIGPVLFDTGYASHFLRATAPFPERLYRWTTPLHLPAHQTLAAQLRRFGLTPSDILMCVISHFHADHIAGLRDLPRARFIASTAGYAQIANAGRFQGLIHGLLPRMLPDDFGDRVAFAESAPKVRLQPPWNAFGEGFDLLGDRSLVGVTLPGHSAGQIGVLLRDEAGRDVFLCADACWSHKAFRDFRMPSFLARPLMHSWFDYCRTIENIHALAERHPELAILPSHCNESLSAYQQAWEDQ